MVRQGRIAHTAAVVWVCPNLTVVQLNDVVRFVLVRKFCKVKIWFISVGMIIIYGEQVGTFHDSGTPGENLHLHVVNQVLFDDGEASIETIPELKICQL